MAIDDNFERSIGARLRTARHKRGFTLQALAAELGVTYQQVRKYETGRNRISASMLYKVAAFLDVDVSYFFKGLPLQDVSDPQPFLRAASDIDAALSRVEDAETRLRLAALIDAVEGLSRKE